MFSCEFCKIFKNTFFTEHLRVTKCFFFIFDALKLSPQNKEKYWNKGGYYCKMVSGS